MWALVKLQPIKLQSLPHQSLVIILPSLHYQFFFGNHSRWVVPSTVWLLQAYSAADSWNNGGTIVPVSKWGWSGPAGAADKEPTSRDHRIITTSLANDINREQLSDAGLLTHTTHIRTNTLWLCWGGGTFNNTRGGLGRLAVLPVSLTRSPPLYHYFVDLGASVGRVVNRGYILVTAPKLDFSPVMSSLNTIMDGRLSRLLFPMIYSVLCKKWRVRATFPPLPQHLLLTSIAIRFLQTFFKFIVPFYDISKKLFTSGILVSYTYPAWWYHQ